MKINIPAAGHRLRLLSDWEFELYYAHMNNPLGELLRPGFKHQHNTFSIIGTLSARVKLEAGAVLDIELIKISKSLRSMKNTADDYNAVTFKLVSHPSLSPKTIIRFWSSREDANRIDAESLSTDSGGAPQKLTARRIHDLFCEEVINWCYPDVASKKRQPAKWFTKKLVSELEAVAAEHNKEAVVAARQSFDAENAAFMKDVQKLLDTGMISAPGEFATSVTTIADVIEQLPPGTPWPLEFREADHHTTWQRFVPGSIVNPAVAVVSESTSPDGSVTRKFTNVPITYGTKYFKTNVEYPKFSVAFTSDTTDTKIVSVTVKGQTK